MKPSETLIAAKLLITTEQHWLKGTYAANSKGQWVPIYHPTASCFCSLGAIRKTYPQDLQAYDWLHKAINESANTYKSAFSAIAEFNDNNPHKTVLQMWDRAITLAQDHENI